MNELRRPDQPFGRRRSPDHSAAPRSASLQGLLRRAHVTLALGAVAIVGLVLAIPAVTTLRIYAGHDLQLLGRAISQTVEAAVVFGDADAAQEALDTIVAGEDLASAIVTTRDGRVLARWQADRPGWETSLATSVSHLLRERPAMLPVMHDGANVGRIVVQDGGRKLLYFLGFGALGIVFCQVLIAIGALYLSGRIFGRIVRPLQVLADVAGAVQRERAFGRRVPGAEIAELNDLGTSFNALLAELHSWQTLMQGENQRLLHEASHDGLTGLANRAFFEGRLERALIDAAQSGTRVALLLLDCDKFKQINDGYGHAAGDAVLVGIAARLRAQFRGDDLVARLGGDEFAVLVAPSPAAAEVPGLGDKVTHAMQHPVIVRDELGIVASLSVGFSTFPEDGTEAAALMQRADEAMYRAKRSRAAGTA